MTFHQFVKTLNEEQLAMFMVDIAEKCVNENKVPKLEYALETVKMEITKGRIARKVAALNIVECVVWTASSIKFMEMFGGIPIVEWGFWRGAICIALTAITHGTFKYLKGDYPG